MTYLLDLVYVLLLIVISPWFAWQAWRTGKSRRGLAARMSGQIPDRIQQNPCIWLHAVSVGEVNLLQPLIADLEAKFPGYECVVSSTTESGFALAQKKYAPRYVFRCPLDFSWAVRRVLARLQPKLLVLAELELWPNLITLAHRKGVKIAVVNGRLSSHSFRGYRRTGPFARWLLSHIDVLVVQTQEFAQRFRDLGAKEGQIYLAGSLKFDGASTDRDNETTRQLVALAGFTEEDVVFLAGSTQEPEERLALATFQTLAAEHPYLRLVLVPRHPERFDEVADMLDHAGVAWRRRSELQNSESAGKQAPVLLVDSVGELWAWWGSAQIAYVGGSMVAREGQNMIEPAAYGAVVSFGPRTRNFRDVVAALLAADAAIVVQDGQELTRFVRRALEDDEFAANYGRAAQRLVASQLGATQRTADVLSQLL